MQFHKFPRTKHLPWSNIVDRDDMILSEEEAEAILSAPRLIGQEKVDGSNCGISVFEGEVVAQNRGHFVTKHPQFDPLKRWIAERAQEFKEVLGPDLILFGEWLYARHTCVYTALPSWFLAFDLYDKTTGKFNQDDLYLACDILDIPRPQTLFDTGPVTRSQLEALLKTKSAYGGQEIEGIYIKALDTDGTVLARCKLVRDSFQREIEDKGNWMAKGIVKNGII